MANWASAHKATSLVAASIKAQWVDSVLKAVSLASVKVPRVALVDLVKEWAALVKEWVVSVKALVALDKDWVASDKVASVQESAVQASELAQEALAA